MTATPLLLSFDASASGAFAGVGILGFTTTSYNCGTASALPGIAFGVLAAQIPGPGLLNSVNADFLPGGGTEIDPSPFPGPNNSPINNPAAINAAAGAGQAPGYHTSGCSPNTSLIGTHGGARTVAVDYITNQVFVPIPSNALGTAGTNNQVVGQFGGWQTSGSTISLIPIDPQYPPSATATACNDGTSGAPPCVGLPAVASVWDGFTKLCSLGLDVFGNTGSDTNGCILVLQDGP
jgi:hypothetical protein